MFCVWMSPTGGGSLHVTNGQSSLQEYERAVLFRLGRLKQAHPVGPGVFFVLPCIETFKRVSLLIFFPVTPSTPPCDIRVPILRPYRIGKRL
jgi:hypothetical protein